MEPGAARQAARKRHGECRQCAAWCDRVIEPRQCVRIGCPNLYAYDDELSGRRYMGCLYKVFGVEIDVELFEEANRTRLGWGGVKVTGVPLPHCPFEVEAAFAGDGERFDCVNPRFFDCADESAEGIRAFDLRDRLAD